MWAGGLLDIFGRALVSALACVVSACAAPSSYYGVDVSGVVALKPDCANEASRQRCYSELALPHLARLAQANDKAAQLELGLRFEEGRGVERDTAAAERLYLAASTDIGGSATVYAPSSRKGERGRITSARTAVKIAGLPEAREHLERLRQRTGRCDAGC